MSDKVLLVGELNPYGADPYFALYPAPDGCSGHRLCKLILGMSRAKYLEAFDRVNLCAGKWSKKDARRAQLELTARRYILLGSKVCGAFETPFEPFAVRTWSCGVIGNFRIGLILPHPSGLCRLWSRPGYFKQAREAVAAFAPEVAPLMREYDIVD